MRGGVDVGPRLMQPRVDREGSAVQEVDLAMLDDVAFVIDAHQIGDADVAKRNAGGVQPEMIGILGIAHRNVASAAEIEAELPEQPERGGEPLLAVEAL